MGRTITFFDGGGGGGGGGGVGKSFEINCLQRL